MLRGIGGKARRQRTLDISFGERFTDLLRARLHRCAHHGSKELWGFHPSSCNCRYAVSYNFWASSKLFAEITFNSSGCFGRHLILRRVWVGNDVIDHMKKAAAAQPSSNSSELISFAGVNSNKTKPCLGSD
jgi:hypothetical protein